MPLPNAVLSKYKKYSNIFVETGTCGGNGVQTALDCGFERVISIEVDTNFYNQCKARFKNKDNIQLIHGDSGKILFDVIKDIDERMIFWLDGHVSFPENQAERGEKYNPIADELNQIAKHHIKNHIHLIDDRRLFGTPDFDNLTENDLKNMILNINKDYLFCLEEGHQIDDILASFIP